MSYYLVYVHAEKSSRRRKMAVETVNEDLAKKKILEQCQGTGFTPDLTSLQEISFAKYQQAISVLTGKNNGRL